MAENSPLNMGAPWASLSGLAGAGDPQAAKNIGAEIDPVLKQQLDRLSWIAASGKVANEAAAIPFPPDEISMKTDPKTGQRTVNVKTSAENYENTTRSAMNWHTALGGMQQELQNMDAKLKAQEQAARNQPPWIQLATALSANLASQKDMPGWVRGLGQTAAQLNPRPEEIQARRLGVLGEEAKLAEAGARIGQDTKMLEYQRKLAEGQQKPAEKAFNELGQAAQKGELTDIPLTSQVLQGAGLPKEKADAQAELLVKASKEKQTLVAAAQAATDKRAADALTARATESDKRLAVMLKGMAIKSSDKSESDKAIETTAQSIAAGDLSSIKDISSFRGSERTRIYARAKEINPNFSVAETKRKIDMEQSFTVGKDGQGLQSFDTFLQHAGEVTETLKGIELTNSPLLNKSLNWWRKNMAGTPELARLETSLEPVGKEFESFLLNQRALYSEDRKKVDALLNPNQPLKVTMATLGQMGKTAKDRFSAMNKRYRGVMKQDIENPFSEEAKAAAAKIGIDLPQGSAPGEPAKKYPWEK